MPITIDADRLNQELATLATFTTIEQPAEGTAVTRVVFSPDDLRARAWLKGLARSEGFTIREDAVGNTFIRLEGSDPSLAAVATGSHIDAIPHAGMYDGTVGVLGGLEALRAIKHSGTLPRRSVELLLFTSEEPTLLGIGCLGSRLLGGALSPEKADALRESHPAKNQEPRTLHDIRTAAGFTGSLASARLQPGHYHGWIELHIEQGPLLEREHIPLGIVTSIAAPAAYSFTITGLGGHAGALLMPDRRDALCAASELILSIERHTLAANAASQSSDSVATVGTLDIHPGAVNSVPSRVTLSLDIRDTDPTRRESIMQAVRADLRDLEGRRRVTITESLINADQPAQSSPHIVETLEQICRAKNLPYKKMVSRAYHDSLFMAPLTPIAMLFIPCRNGVSHRPDEYAAPADIALGTQVLAEALFRLADE